MRYTVIFIDPDSMRAVCTVYAPHLDVAELAPVTPDRLIAFAADRETGNISGYELKKRWEASAIFVEEEVKP